ncbi:MAG: hypothetical protein AAGH19_01270 [Pseudomonadota bacterium]
MVIDGENPRNLVRSLLGAIAVFALIPLFASTARAQDSQDVGTLQCIFSSTDWLNFSAPAALASDPDNFRLGFNPPQPSEFSDFTPTAGGQIGFFTPTDGLTFSLLNGSESLFSGQAVNLLFGLEQATEGDFVAVGGTGLDTALGDDLFVGGFSIEFFDEDGTAIPTVQSWLFDYGDFEQSRCAFDLVNAAGVVQGVIEGEVSLPDSEQPTGDTIQVPYGDVDALITAIETANQDTTRTWRIELTGQPADFVYTQPYQGTGNALPEIKSKIIFIALRPDGTPGDFATHRRAVTATRPFRFMELSGEGVVEFSSPFGTVGASFTTVADFSSDGDGGAFLVRENALLSGTNVSILDSAATGNGGAVAVSDQGDLSLTGEGFVAGCSSEANGGAISFSSAGGLLVEGSFWDNASDGFGGAIAVFAGDGPNSSVDVGFGTYRNNSAGDGGAHLYIQSDASNVAPTQVTVKESTFERADRGRGVVFDGVRAELQNNTFKGPSDGPTVASGGEVLLLGNVFDDQPDEAPNQLQGASARAKTACDAGNGTLTSLGFNVASDNSCNLSQASDVSGMDPLLSEPDENGVRSPLPGSPAIDLGPDSAIVLPEDSLATLPCGFKDAYGLGRPQDGDGDGRFDCDAGAVEVQGSGQISAGHSAAFYNPLRNGEGHYVEILSDELAVVYVFSYRPDASGPAWFTGVGQIVGNSIVFDELLRSEGTSFGNAFDSEEIVRTPAGGAAMVVPSCEVQGDGGVMAFEGDSELGYEAQLGPTQRLTRVTGCGFQSTPNTGLSGTYFDPDRDGEGLIIQWLANGDVTVMFFTHGRDGRQFWIVGTGTPNDRSVSINAVYPAQATAWGSSFDPDDVVLEPWGTFELNWTGCDRLSFRYAGQVQGFGTATRQYQRLTRLQGTSCPDFN